MSENYKLYPLKAQPGIKKDGTQTEGDNWQSGQWVRFYRGLPRSMLGYRSMTEAYPGPSRGLFVSLNGSGFLDIFSGSASALNVGQFTTDGFGSGIVDITPSGFVANSANVWQLDSFYNENGGGETDLIAHAAPNLVDISSNVATQVYYGDITAAIPLLGAVDDSSNPVEVSGGILALNPYVIAYGSLGLIWWSSVDDPTTFPIANQANPTPTKIVKGLSLKGSAAPACLLWSLDSLILMSFSGGDTVWSFETISDQSSVLSSSGMIEMDGVYYWPGIDRWLTYNGVLRELPNEINLDFFYSNLNVAERQKVFGFKVPRWGEIWWCFPMGNATECNHAIIYNVRENTWYDTPLPVDGRSAAYFAQSWQYPVMFGANVFPDNKYQLWQHEFGYDQIQGTNVSAIESFIESPDIAMIGGGIGIGIVVEPQDNAWTQLAYFEPDFLMGPSLNIQVIGRQFSMDDDTILDSTNIVQQPKNNYYALQCQARYVRWRIASNVQGGYFIMGQPMFSFRPGDRTP